MTIYKKTGIFFLKALKVYFENIHKEGFFVKIPFFEERKF